MIVYKGIAYTITEHNTDENGEYFWVYRLIENVHGKIVKNTTVFFEWEDCNFTYVCPD